MMNVQIWRAEANWVYEVHMCLLSHSYVPVFSLHQWNYSNTSANLVYFRQLQ